SSRFGSIAVWLEAQRRRWRLCFLQRDLFTTMPHTRSTILQRNLALRFFLPPFFFLLRRWARQARVGRRFLPGCFMLCRLPPTRTFFGFVVFFALAVHEAAKNSRPVAGALLWAGKRVFPFGLIAAGYVLANLLNPRKALHLRE